MRRAGSIAICGAILTLASDVGAQLAIAERVRIQAGFTTQVNPAPAPRVNDPWGSAAPAVTFFWFTPDAIFSLDESVNGIYHNGFGTTELDDFLVLAARITLSQKTQLFLTANGSYSSISQLLVANPAPNTNLALLPPTTTKIVSVRVNEVLTHDVLARLRLTQTADASVFTTLPPGVPLDTFAANLGLGLQYVWPTDAVGFDARGGYGEALTVPPAFDAHFFTVSAGPTWRHDWSSTVTSLANAGVGLAISMDSGPPILAPAALANVTYTGQSSTVALTYQTGFFPSLLTGQLIKSHTATLRVLYPLSLTKQVFVGASVGGSRSELIDLRIAANDTTFNSVLSDLDVTWQATPLIQPFARYQFLAQIGDANAAGFNPSYLLDTFIVGVQITSKPPAPDRGAVGGYFVPTTPPQRVDRGDVIAVPGQTDPNAPPLDVPPPRPDGVVDGVQRPDQPPAPPKADPNLNDVGGSRWIYTRPAPAPTSTSPKPN